MAVFTHDPIQSLRDAQVPPYAFPVELYGAKGDGVTDDSAAIQVAIDAAVVFGGGTVVFGPKDYAVAGGLRVMDAVFLQGAGAGDDPSAALGNQGVTRLVWTGVSGGGPMVTFKAAAAGNWVNGGGIGGMVLDGANLAATGVQLDSCQFTVAGAPGNMMRYSAFQTQALLISSTNGQNSRFCEVYGHSRAGGNAATLNSHGLVIDAGLVGNTSHHVWLWYGTVQDGYSTLVKGFVDNVEFHLLGGFGTGTGGQIRFEAAGAPDAPATNILHTVLGGEVQFADNSYGNIIRYHSSENGSLSFGASASGHYRTHDKYHGDLFETHVYPMDDELFVPGGAMLPTLGTVAYGSGQQLNVWGAQNLDTAADERLGVCAGRPRWADGEIWKVRLHFGHTAATSSVQWAAVVSLNTSQAGVSIGPAEHTSSIQAVPLNDTPNIDEFYDYILATPLAYARGDAVWLAVERRGATSGGVDTFASVLRFTGATIFYRSDGPNGNTAGTFDIPLPYHI